MGTATTRTSTFLIGLALLLAMFAGSATTAAAAAPSTIKYGDRNWSVVCLQQGLNYYAWTSGGKILPAGNVDGIFGQKTLSAVRSLQVYTGRRMTGVVDKATGEELAKGLWYTQGTQNIKDWLRYCQHTIPRYHNYPVA